MPSFALVPLLVLAVVPGAAAQVECAARDAAVAAREAAVQVREVQLRQWEARLRAWDRRARRQGHLAFDRDTWRQKLDLLPERLVQVGHEEMLVLWINLERRPDRRAALEGVLRGAGLNARHVRVPAVDGRELSRAKCLQSMTTDARGGFNVTGRATIVHRGGVLEAFHGDVVTPGVVGVALSHRRAWRAIIANTLTAPQVVMEDDVGWMRPDMDEVLRAGAKHLSTVDPQWDVWYVSYHGCHDDAAAAAEAAVDLPDVRSIAIVPTDAYYFSGLFTYAVNGQRAARRLLDLWPLPPGQVDKFVFTECARRGLRCHRTARGACPTFTPLSERSLDSDVQTFADAGV